MNQSDRSWYAGRRVFLTGHTGFKGAWLSLWLQDMGAQVHGYALHPADPCLFSVAKVGAGMTSTFADIRDRARLEAAVAESGAEVIVHMAAQSLVLASHVDPCTTFDVNVQGTANVLDCARRAASVRAVVIVTSDKCYENANRGGLFREDEPMGGADPYSASKGCAELVTSSFARSYFSDGASSAIASARAGNVIGGGDWAENRLVPDMMRAAASGRAVEIRRQNAVRPWQFVLEPLRGYLGLARRLAEEGRRFSGGWNFGPREADMIAVREVVSKTTKLWPAVTTFSSEHESGPGEAAVLRLDCTKAATFLDWRPVLDLDQGLKLTVDWYRAAHERPDRIRETTLHQLHEYEARVAQHNLGMR